MANSTPEEQANTYVLFVTSDTQFHGGGRRSHETATIAQKVAEKVFKDRGLPAENILNLSHHFRGLESGDRLPKVMSKLREPRFIDKSPEFLAHLMETQGEGEMGLKFWIGFEEDLERETRIAMKAEGPDDIADRMAAAVRVFNRYGSSFLSTHPKGRLVVWASTHTDGLSPLVRKHVLHKEITESPVIVADYGGGLVIDIDPKSHTATTTIAGEQYPFPLEK